MESGIVLYGINNIFTVQYGEKLLECRLKGKKLKGHEKQYNPIAPGDRVFFKEDSGHAGKGMITGREDRRNDFSRWNKKRNSPQTVAANIDLLVCLASPDSPPFRPRFIDRVLIMAEDHFPVLILVNKMDQGMTEDVKIRLEDFKAMGYDYRLCSAKTGEGVDELKAFLKGKTAAFVGQSGVGKSSILNTLEPSFNLRVGEISDKYNRGRHTTNYGILLPWEGGALIDTPGIREIHLCGVEARNLARFMPDLVPFIDECNLPACLHIHEPNCGVRDAAERGDIHPDRYESYLRMYYGLLEIEEENKYG
ncbi:MAG: ribosome small subunit-dependent GTPase A [Spirochaetales bacterium]|nr:ribosome small subunit-dependent GTPase A [Spirochaetales bacterium]